MPAALTYPGVYVEEISSGVRTIVGVATSIAAFVGRTARGPVQEPRTITSYADYERIYGPLSRDYPLGYAVRDFYLNGGTTAIILRLYKKTGNAEGVATGAIGALNLKALSPGKWGEKIIVSVEAASGVTEDYADSFDPSLAAADFFNLVVAYGTAANKVETYLAVTMKDKGGNRRLDRVLAAESNYVAIAGALADVTAPAAGNVTLANGDEGQPLDQASFALQKDNNNDPIPKTGIAALDKVDLFNLLCIAPPAIGADSEVPKAIWADVLPYCVKRRAMLIVDPPKAWTGIEKVKPATAIQADLGLQGPDTRNAAIYFPRVLAAEPVLGATEVFVPSGMMAGVMARTDVTRGVWKAPAGVDAALVNAQGLTVTLTDLENGQLNPFGINCLRTFPVIGTVAWGARTLRGADLLADEWKYIPVRRLALFLEESLFRGLQWVVFEPNDEPLWAAIRLNVGAFMNDQFRQGAFQGGTPKDAYFVVCDKTNNPQSDINKGIVNVIVGFAPLKPAEFVVLKIQQMAGQIQT